MESRALLELPCADFERMRGHLLPPDSRSEEAVFIFAKADADDVFTPVDWRLIPPDGFEARSSYYLQLTDETRRSLIKQAHNLEASMIELHSHPFDQAAAFSLSDCSGFREFVPHVRWRLKCRPYAAIVLAGDSFDSLAWFADLDAPQLLDIRLDDGRLLQPTENTYRRWRTGHDY